MEGNQKRETWGAHRKVSGEEKKPSCAHLKLFGAHLNFFPTSMSL